MYLDFVSLKKHKYGALNVLLIKYDTIVKSYIYYKRIFNFMS